MPLKFFGLTFAASWLLWAGALALSPDGELDGGAVAGAVFLIGVFAPGLTALALTHRDGGSEAAGMLIGRVLAGRVDLRFYAFALALMPATKLIVALLHRLITGEWPVFGTKPWYLMAGAIVLSIWVQAGEEVGWRGYALPRLADRLGLPAASLVLGVVWAVWHLPLFFVRGGDTFGQSFPFYLLQVTALSVVMAWLYWRTEGSLLLVMLLHASINNTKDIAPSAVQGAADSLSFHATTAGWLTLAVLWTVAAALLAQMRAPKNPLPADF